MALTAIRVVLALALYIVGAVVLGLALFPAVWLCRSAWLSAAHWTLWQQTLWVCLAAGVGYFIFGFSLMFISALLRWVFRLDVREGEYPLGKTGAVLNSVAVALIKMVLSHIVPVNVP